MAIIERVPRTNLRQKHLIKVYSAPTQSAFSLSDVAPEYLNNLITTLSSKPPIGGIQKLSIETNRDLFEWRELNYETLGRVMEVYPSLGEFRVSVERIAFYDSHLLDAFRAVDKDVFAGSNTSDPVSAGYNIYNQIAPLFILADVLTPSETLGENAYTASQNISVLLYDCWFDKSEVKFSVTDADLKMIQSAELTCAGIYTVKA